ncbi:hypothetical protein B0H13DRAFT_1609050, partial [Mycena leptocephala]
RGRRALMMGGVIARLAAGLVSPQTVCSGPTTNVHVDGQCIWDGRPTSPAYWDDFFTKQELDIICGMYERHDGKQKKLVSWWPPLAAWVSSGLNMGHWTPSCEEWYQSRLAEIRAGHAQLHTQLQWRQKLMRVPSPLLLTNDQLAASFLAENGTRIATGALAQQFPKAILSRDPRKNSGDRSYFTLRTQRSESPTPQAEPTKPLPPQSCSVPKVSAETKQTLSPEIQQLTRQYWDTRRTIMSLALRGNAIEQRLRNLHVKDPDIYLTSTGTTSG